MGERIATLSGVVHQVVNHSAFPRVYRQQVVDFSEAPAHTPIVRAGNPVSQAGDNVHGRTHNLGKVLPSCVVDIEVVSDGLAYERPSQPLNLLPSVSTSNQSDRAARLLEIHRKNVRQQHVHEQATVIIRCVGLNAMWRFSRLCASRPLRTSRSSSTPMRYPM